MRKNISPKAYICPLPVLVIGSYDENQVPNAMTAAWGSVCDTKQVSIVISSTHKTMKNILLNKEFSVSITNEENIVEADYVGIVSGNSDLNKLEKINWTIQKSEFVNAPLFLELPLALECKMIEYDEEKEMLIGEVINVSVDEKIINNGKIDINLLKPVCYDTFGHNYYVMNKIVGKAFSDGKKLK